ncbi:hypothetical protein OBBRIDRAFT_851504, partial [Obba rivulosa]
MLHLLYPLIIISGIVIFHVITMKGLVTGLVLDSKDKPDPICKACLSGKMHAHPKSPSSSLTTQLLELVHTD